MGPSVVEVRREHKTLGSASLGSDLRSQRSVHLHFDFSMTKVAANNRSRLPKVVLRLNFVGVGHRTNSIELSEAVRLFNLEIGSVAVCIRDIIILTSLALRCRLVLQNSFVRLIELAVD